MKFLILKVKKKKKKGKFHHFVTNILVAEVISHKKERCYKRDLFTMLVFYIFPDFKKEHKISKTAILYTKETNFLRAPIQKQNQGRRL